MKFSLSKNNAGGSVEAASPTFKTLRCLSGRYLHMLWSGSATRHEDQMNEDDTVDDERHVQVVKFAPSEEKFWRLFQYLKEKFRLTSAPSPILISIQPKLKEHFSAHDWLQHWQGSQTLSTAAWTASWGRPRQEEELLSWLTHALVPSDVHAQDKKIADLCDSQVEDASPKFVSRVSIKWRETTRRISVASIPEERWSYWLTRPLRTARKSDASAQGDLQPPTSLSDHSRTPSIPATRFSSAYASCFASPERQPSVIHWKRP
ncbi:hypothetical protein BDR07DRAFT_1373158 [Suillus spraguei]|nr:hypothetical protein BDR07DRAFT_1373158 [Suillus spraguei]